MKESLLSAASSRSSHYSASEGDELLRNAIVGWEKNVSKVVLAGEDIIVTNGVSEGVNFLLNALIEPCRGDETLVPAPSYPIYSQTTTFVGGRPCRTN